MLSRGAARVDFVESERFTAEQIKLNAEKFGVSAECRIFIQDVRTFVKKAEKGYDLIFYDPPYGGEDLQSLIPDIMELLSEGGILVYERSGDKKKAGVENITGPYDVRKFGDTMVEFYRQGTADNRRD